MNQREKLIIKYAADLKAKFDIDADMDLLTKIAIGLGPSIYNRDSATVSSSEAKELETVKERFLKKKLGLEDNLDAPLNSIIQAYGKTNRMKYRVVVYYLLTKHYGKESVYL